MYAGSFANRAPTLLITAFVLALTNLYFLPEKDSELIWKFDKLDERHVQGRFRIAGYLNAQADKLYFQAKQRAVSLQDYTLDMYKVEE